jgi:transcriptional antiterminator NusG
MSEEKQKAWYAVHTYSGYENKVKTNLEKRIETMNMEEYIFRCLIPEETVQEVKNGSVREIKRKIFPGYVLVEMIMTDESWYVVRNTTGVTGFVGAGNKAVPLGDDEVARLLHDMGEEAPVVEFDGAVGDEVQILDSSFSGMTGVIKDIISEKQRLLVAVSMFGRDTEVELDYNQVRSIK